MLPIIVGSTGSILENVKSKLKLVSRKKAIINVRGKNRLSSKQKNGRKLCKIEMAFDKINKIDKALA
jgi:hypothetical protein